MNTGEKQVILSKVEYDEMEQELKALRETVNSKLKIAIVRKDCYDTSHYHYEPSFLMKVGTKIDFIIGVDDNEIIKELSEDNDSLSKKNKECEEQLFILSREMCLLKDASNSWKKLPWYKRLFV